MNMRQVANDTLYSIGENPVVYTVVVVVGLALTFFITDCSKGETSEGPGRITAHNYVPAHSDVHTVTDKNGKSHDETDYTSESYKLCASGSGVAGCWETTMAQYASVKDGDHVKLFWRTGKYTGWVYAIGIR